MALMSNSTLRPYRKNISTIQKRMLEAASVSISTFLNKPAFPRWNI